MRIEQTLHGYDDGHRRLAASTDLSTEEQRALDLLSDLSGYLPPDGDFDFYDTGYPCGRFYAYARTWLDRAGRRSGTVFTQSLLIPRAELETLETLLQLADCFALPKHPVDRRRFECSFEHVSAPAPQRTPATGTGSELPLVARRHLAAAWFGQDARPLLWTDPSTAHAAGHFAWAWLPPHIRADVTFCTMALQPRYHGARLFDWLGVAAGAEGHFYDIRDRAVRLDGLTVPNSVAPLLDLKWVDDVAKALLEQVAATWSEATKIGLAELPWSDLRVFLRYLEFRERSMTSYPAALGRIDILRRLAPEPASAAEEKRAALWQWRVQAGQVAAAERDLQLLLDLFDRDPLQFAPSIAADLGAVVEETLAARGLSDLAAAAMVVMRARRAGLAGPAARGIAAALRPILIDGTGDEDSPLLIDLVAEVLISAPEEAAATLLLLPGEQRIAVVDRAARADGVEPGQLTIDLVRAARGMGDLALLEHLPAGILSALEAGIIACEIASEAASPDGKILRRLVEPAGTELVERWLASIWAQSPGAIHVEEALAEVIADSPELRTALAAALPDAAAVSLVCALCARPGKQAIGEVLDGNAEAFRALLRMGRATPHRTGVGDCIELLLPRFAADLVSTEFDADSAERWEEASWAGAIVRRMIVADVQHVLAGAKPIERAQRWLASRPAQAHLRSGRAGDLVQVLARVKGDALPRAIGVLALPEMAPVRGNAFHLRECLQRWGQLPPEDIAVVVPAWAALVQSINAPDVHAEACAITLKVALSFRGKSFAPLAEVAFATAHGELYQGARFGHIIVLFLAIWLGKDWDRAQHLREQLVTLWMDEEWPPLSLLRAAGEDEKLFDMLAEIAADRKHGKRALRQLFREASAPDAPHSVRVLAWRLPSSVTKS